MPIGPEDLAAYFNAGIAISGSRFGITVRRLSLRVENKKRVRPSLTPLSHYLRGVKNPSHRAQIAREYATVLLSGTVGRFIGVEHYLAYAFPSIEIVRLERGYLLEARQCIEPETDQAFGIIVGWTKDLNSGNAMLTFGQVWKEALVVLREPSRQAALISLVAALKKKREMYEEDIEAALQ